MSYVEITIFNLTRDAKDSRIHRVEERARRELFAKSGVNEALKKALIE